MNKYLFVSTALLSLCLIINSCAKGPCDDTPANYAAVKTIIDGSCAYTGCHDGTGSNAFIPTGANDYTNFAGLKASLDGGSFNTRTLDKKTMPPAAFVPAGFPTTLTEEQLKVLTCWHEAGYPEN